MSEKKVIAVIVEGPSDENAIGGILKEYFSSAEVQFAVVHGDITSNNSTSVENAVSKVDQIIYITKRKSMHLLAEVSEVLTKQVLQKILRVYMEM